MTGIEAFCRKFDDFSAWTPQKQVDYIAYYLLTEGKKYSVTAKDISDAFRELSLREYHRLSQYLSEKSTGPTSKYIKDSKSGYRLERLMFDTIDALVKNEPMKIQVAGELVDLVAKVTDSHEKSFLVEAINCYRVEAFRAAIVMTWALTIDHLQRFVFAQKLNAFNDALSKNSDKRMKKVINLDDFSELRETKFLALLRAANIISNDVHKILDEKLGIRNSAAHPSGIIVSGHKTTEFIHDLIANVVLKY